MPTLLGEAGSKHWSSWANVEQLWVSFTEQYVTERFLQTIEREITTGNLNPFRTHALIEAQTQDYGRDAQIQLILHL